MSATSQTSAKKSGSSNSSMANTPASTPVSTMANGQTTTQTSPPPNNNAPKYGTLVPNRIFVGGISANTTESELLQLFSNYGTVKAAKIIQDRAGVSKGYGFITFESEDDAKRLQREADNIVLRERKLNIAPAIKKQSLQPFSRTFDASSPPAVTPGNAAQYFFPPSAMPYFQGGVAYYPQPPTGPADPTTQQQTVYQPPSVYPPQSAPPQTAAYPPVMFPAQPIYMPQQYPMPMPYDYNYYANGGAQYMVGSQGGPQSQVPPMQRPNSPPRPPCYSQQIPYSNPPDAMYYNVPIYGPVDGPMYTETPGMDMPMPNGSVPEGYFTQEFCSQVPSSATGNTTTIPPTSSSANEIHQSVTSQTAVGSGGGGGKDDVDRERKSHTPVVSLLSLDQHQEKDLVSMQSGRRRKEPAPPAPPQVAPPAQYQHNGYPLTGYGGYLPPAGSGGYVYFSQNISPSKTPPMANGWTKRWRGGDKRVCGNESSVSSLRTDSNSSASVVDENRNEEKLGIKTPPPPAPYSPIINCNRSFYNSHAYHNYPAATRGRGGGVDRRGPPNSQRIAYHSNNNKSNPNSHKGKDGQQPPHYSVTAKSHPSSFPQMHPSAQHFVPPTRRNRRTVRRNGSSTLSEIGAGDAPLPNSADVTEACNKLDGLKL